MAMDILTMRVVFYRLWTNFLPRSFLHRTEIKNDQQQKCWTTESLFSSLQKITVLYVERNTKGGRIFRFDRKEVIGRLKYISDQNGI